MDRAKTLLLMAALTALFLRAGHAFGGQGGLVLALGLAAIMNFGTYWFSARGEAARFGIRSPKAVIA